MRSGPRYVGAGSLARSRCYVIAGGGEDLYGLAIKERLEDYYETDINHGRLYPNLDDLVERGLVAKGELDGRTNTYTVTDRGVWRGSDQGNRQRGPRRSAE